MRGGLIAKKANFLLQLHPSYILFPSNFIFSMLIIKNEGTRSFYSGIGDEFFGKMKKNIHGSAGKAYGFSLIAIPMLMKYFYCHIKMRCKWWSLVSSSKRFEKEFFGLMLHQMSNMHTQTKKKIIILHSKISKEISFTRAKIITCITKFRFVAFLHRQ